MHASQRDGCPASSPTPGCMRSACRTACARAPSRDQPRPVVGLILSERTPPTIIGDPLAESLRDTHLSDLLDASLEVAMGCAFTDPSAKALVTGPG
jgi:hypothetical protein